MTQLASAPQAGPLGLLVVIALGIAVAFLARSLIKHLNRVPASFDRSRADESTPADRTTSNGAQRRTAPPDDTDT